MRITEIFSLGRDHRDHDDGRWFDDGWRNRDYDNRGYDNQGWGHPDWDRGHDN